MKLRPLLHIHLFRKRFHSFHFFGAIGFFVGVLLGVLLAFVSGIAIWPVLLCSLIGVVVLFGLTFAYKLITGREDLVYYQHEIGIILSCYCLLTVLNLDVLAYLDITLLGVGTFMAFGRWGCFSVGCCHGKPAKLGAVYTPEHAIEGFPAYYVGLKIFPIPLVESAWVFITVCIGSLTVVKGLPAGTALVVYTVVYGLARFFLEFFRGDPERPYWNGFSEAQWTTLVLMATSLWGAWSGYLPFYIWHFWAIGLLGLFMVLYKSYELIFPFHKNRLLNPHHIKEIARSIRTANVGSHLKDSIKVANTSLGIQISIGKTISKKGEALKHFTISGGKNKRNKKIALNENIANRMADLLTKISRHLQAYEIVQGSPGFYHIVFYEPKNTQQNTFLKYENTLSQGV